MSSTLLSFNCKMFLIKFFSSFSSISFISFSLCSLAIKLRISSLVESLDNNLYYPAFPVVYFIRAIIHLNNKDFEFQTVLIF